MLEQYNMPVEGDTRILTSSYELLSDFIDASETEARITPAATNESKLTEYIYNFGHIERLNLIESKFSRLNHISAERSIVDTSIYSNVLFSDGALGLFIIKSSNKPVYIYPNEYIEETHLEAAEKLLNQGRNHELEIFTVTNSNHLFVYTNKKFKYETYLKLDLLMWQINKEKLPGYREEIEEMICALLSEDKERYCNAITKLYNDPKLIEIKIKPIMETFKVDKTYRINECKQIIYDARERIENYRNELCRSIKRLEEYNEQLAMLEASEETTDINVLKKYIIKCPYIVHVRKTSEQNIRLQYKAPILYFDEYILEKIISKAPDSRLKILKIFEKNEFELMTNCEIDLNTRYFSVTKGIRIGITEDATPHPHIDNYGCFGNHSTIFAEVAESADYLMLLEEITQAVLNLNFTDHIVVQTMLDTILTNMDMKWWRNKETGEQFSTNEIIEQYY